jgi:hypothetical protein
MRSMSRQSTGRLVASAETKRRPAPTRAPSVGGHVASPSGYIVLTAAGRAAKTTFVIANVARP